MVIQSLFSLRVFFVPGPCFLKWFSMPFLVKQYLTEVLYLNHVVA